MPTITTASIITKAQTILQDTTGVRWQTFGNDLPNTLVADLAISPLSVLTAATYGRGAFRLQLPTP